MESIHWVSGFALSPVGGMGKWMQCFVIWGYISIYIYIYIEREREREKERDIIYCYM
jgi:hypothetical protein